MMRFSALLLALFLAATMSAQNADLRVSLETPESVVPGQTFTFRGTIHNDGPGDAEEMTLYLVGYDQQPYCYDAVSVPGLKAGESRTYECTVTAKTPPYFIVTHVGVLSPQDRRTENNVITREVLIITPPDLVIWPPYAGTTVPGLPATFALAYTNIASVDATNVVLSLEAPTPILKAPEGCRIEGTRAICNLGTVPARSNYATLVFEYLAPDISEHAFSITADIAGSEGEADPDNNRAVAAGRTYRTFSVTNTADSGSGSLRAALEGANASCTEEYPCLVAFRIPTAGQQWHTIRVESPLPRVVAEQVEIDATTQTRYFGDSNPLGPEIEVSGSENAGNGFEMAVPCRASIAGMTINGFPGAAADLIASRPCPPGGWARLIIDNYIGTDPTGARAVPNERGVVVHIPDGEYPWRISQNVISGNRRSAIFIGSGARMLIHENILGLNAAVTAALGNGASGIYLSPAAHTAEIKNNYIGFNAHFGVAIALGTRDVVMSGNSFQANHQHAIDYGLDGVVTDDQAVIPEITNVRVENGVTVIEGRVTRRGNFGVQVGVYANDAPDPSGYGEGQYYLGTIWAHGDTFTFRHPHDLTGKWVTATSTDISIFGFLRVGDPRPDNHERHGATSEFSRAVEVR